MSLKGQSALENLITYGWMLVAITVISGVIFGANLGNSCELRVDSPFGSSPLISDIARGTDGRIALELRNPQDNAITVEEIRFKKDGELRTSVDLNRNIRGKATAGYKTTNFQDSEDCNTYQLEAEYSAGTLGNLISKSTVEGRVSIVKLLPKFNIDPVVAKKGEIITLDASPSETSNSIQSYEWNLGGETASGQTVTTSYNSNGAYAVKLFVTDEKGNTATKTKTVFVGGIIFEEGGSITKLGINSTLASNCIGNQCANATGGGERRTYTGGDKLKGTLLVRNITEQESEICISSNQSLGTDTGCPKTRIPSQNTTLTKDNNIMYGSLEAPVIKPQNSKICVGEC